MRALLAIASLAVLLGAAAAGNADSPVPEPPPAGQGAPPESLLASAASLADTLAALDAGLEHLDAAGQALAAEGVVLGEIVAAARELYANGDVDAAAILLEDGLRWVRGGRP